MDHLIHLQQLPGLKSDLVQQSAQESIIRLTLERDGEVRVYLMVITKGIRLNLESRRKLEIKPNYPVS